MSVTTTANARLLATANYLSDYELHHSQPSSPASAPAPNQHLDPSPATNNNPPDWQAAWRRVPAYRPVVNQLDEQRTTVTSEAERTFIRVMFLGELVLNDGGGGGGGGGDLG